MTQRSLFLIGCAMLSLWALASCSSKSASPAPALTTRQAAASASAAQGAIELSSSIGMAAGTAAGYLPPQVRLAPGKTAPAASTEAIANIDPRLKDVVDRMLAHLGRAAVTERVPKQGLQKTMSAPVSFSVSTGCAVSGTFSVTDTRDTIVTAPGGTVHSFAVTFTDCRDTLATPYEILSGSITGTYNNYSDASHDAEMHVGLTASEYSAMALKGTVTMNGDFRSQMNGTGTASQHTANGSFVARSYVGGDVTLSLLFTDVADAWTYTGAGLPATVEHIGNGGFGLTITNNANGQSLGLTVTLTDVVDRITTNADLSMDTWINGTVNISWAPDLSQWGCLNRDYLFTTAANTPIHAPFMSSCPTSGTVQVNNARIDFGAPSGEMVTVTLLPKGPSEVFADCDSLGSGLCN